VYKLTTLLLVRRLVRVAGKSVPAGPSGSADIFNFQALGCIGIINTEGIGHADGQALGTSERSHDLFHLGPDGHKGLSYPLGNIIGIKTSEQFWILRGNALGTDPDVTDITATLLVTQTTGTGLHDILADMNPGGSEHDQCQTILGHIAVFTHPTGGKERDLVLAALGHQIQITLAQIGGDWMAGCIQRHVISSTGTAVDAVDEQRSGIGVADEILG